MMKTESYSAQKSRLGIGYNLLYDGEILRWFLSADTLVEYYQELVGEE